MDNAQPDQSHPVTPINPPVAEPIPAAPQMPGVHEVPQASAVHEVPQMPQMQSTFVPPQPESHPVSTSEAVLPPPSEPVTAPNPDPMQATPPVPVAFNEQAKMSTHDGNGGDKKPGSKLVPIVTSLVFVVLISGIVSGVLLMRSKTDTTSDAKAKETRMMPKISEEVKKQPEASESQTKFNKDSSDTQIDQDLKAVDANLSKLDSNMTDVDKGLNDKAINLN